MLLLTLRFYATGAFLNTVGDIAGVHKSTASKVIRKVSHAIASLRPQYINLPEGDEIREVNQGFYEIASFPRVIGAIDCTHIKIQSPGDSGYRNRNYLLTPLRNPITRAENLYNEAHIRTRNCVERLYGIWKRRFPVLAHGMRLQLRSIQCVIVATAVLHNIACDEKEEVPPVDADVMMDIVEDVPAQVNFYNVARDNRTRHHLITNYFNNL
ncbi:hypothetical protein MML48_7g00005474 [Holotrichia oblita]|uniref:Uncharacterized protein n=1 Tax=Holotrichia oblita TaxID=644536 RepID=A0ACB9SWG5_HOLOL|nr:hypothetical protein MML48_7g00005474 [Holotrichia oblita]